MHDVTRNALIALAADMRTQARSQEHWAGELDAIISADGMAAAVEAQGPTAADVEPAQATKPRRGSSRNRGKAGKKR